MLNAESFLSECQRFVAAVNQALDTTSVSALQVGLHGRRAKWTLESETDPLGVKQPVLVGKYAVVADNVSSDHEGDDNEDDEPDSLAAAPLQENKSKRTLQITVYISFNQPYGVPALDFTACEMECGGRPVYEVARLQRWLPSLLDAMQIDSRQIALMESGDENARLLSAAPSPRVSVAVHELLNRPAFTVHACDTVSHFKMMMMVGSTSTEGAAASAQRQQSPIDAVLAFYGRFLGL